MRPGRVEMNSTVPSGSLPRLAQGRVDLADVVGRDDREDAVGALDAVQAVEQAVERQRRQRAAAARPRRRPSSSAAASCGNSAVLAGHVLAAVEDVVDVLDQGDARHVDLHLAPGLDQLVVAHLGEVEDVDRHVQVLGEGAGQGRLAGAGRAVEQPAALPGDALRRDTSRGCFAPQLDLVDQVLDPLREDQVVERLAVVQAAPCRAAPACGPAGGMPC